MYYTMGLNDEFIFWDNNKNDKLEYGRKAWDQCIDQEKVHY